MRENEQIRLEYLDGIRGLAALYVVLGHAYIGIREQVDPYVSPLVLKLLMLIDAGHFAVAIFIVLSGYVLMMPIARTPDLSMRGGWWAYIKRRGRRIMPPYYAALVLSLILVLLFPVIAKPGDLAWPAIISHALMVHNLHPETMLAINGPMWSVAMEWQIYFFLPFLLLPMLRRFGPLAMLAAGLAFGMAPYFLLPEGLNFAWTYPWYIGLFAVGGLAALINFSSLPSLRAVRQRTPWMVVSSTLLLTTGGLLLFRLGWAWEYIWFTDTLLGFTTAAGIITLTNALMQPQSAQQGHRRPNAQLLVVRLLQMRWMGMLGAFSYSLYLVHEPVLLVFSSFLTELPLKGLPLLALQYTLVVPVVTGLCYLFYMAFERPFVTKPGHKPAEVKPEAAAAAD